MTKYEPEYLIAQMDSYVGNSIIWWRENSAGYTTDVDKAGRYSESQARSITRDVKTTKAFREDYVIEMATLHVDSQYLTRSKALS